MSAQLLQELPQHAEPQLASKTTSRVTITTTGPNFISHFKFFSGFYVPKFIKIGSFLIELLKIKNVAAF